MELTERGENIRTEMELNLILECLDLAENDFKGDDDQKIFEGDGECPRSDTPSSDASTSGVCSMASSDSEICDEKQFEEQQQQQQQQLRRRQHQQQQEEEGEEEEEEEEQQQQQQQQQQRELVIKYLNRDILDLCNNLYPYGLYQTTSVPKMNMSNYWEGRSIYHRLGPFGDLDEFDYAKCNTCDFCMTVPKRK